MADNTEDGGAKAKRKSTRAKSQARADTPASGDVPASDMKGHTRSKAAGKTTKARKTPSTKAKSKSKKDATLAAAEKAAEQAAREHDLKAGGDLIRRMRETASNDAGGSGISQADLAKRIGITAARMKTLEAGGGRDGVSYELLQRVARAVGTRLVVELATEHSVAPKASSELVDEQPTPTADRTSEDDASTLQGDASGKDEPLDTNGARRRAHDAEDQPASRRDEAEPGLTRQPDMGRGLQAALGLQGRVLMKTLNGLADSSIDREIARRFRAGEHPDDIAVACNTTPIDVIRILREMGFRTRSADRSGNADNRGETTRGTSDVRRDDRSAQAGAATFGRRRGDAGLLRVVSGAGSETSDD